MLPTCPVCTLKGGRGYSVHYMYFYYTVHSMSHSCLYSVFCYFIMYIKCTITIVYNNNYCTIVIEYIIPCTTCVISIIIVYIPVHLLLCCTTVIIYISSTIIGDSIIDTLTESTE